jgi:hypothetical protein
MKKIVIAVTLALSTAGAHAATAGEVAGYCSHMHDIGNTAELMRQQGLCLGYIDGLTDVEYVNLQEDPHGEPQIFHVVWSGPAKVMTIADQFVVEMKNHPQSVNENAQAWAVVTLLDAGEITLTPVSQPTRASSTGRDL